MVLTEQPRLLSWGIWAAGSAPCHCENRLCNTSPLCQAPREPEGVCEKLSVVSYNTQGVCHYKKRGVGTPREVWTWSAPPCPLQLIT